ncbi:nucleotide-binding alpha-beta plait domain-containing protein [Artemisia annua]|uniref:Nucleotide-binding alpha-beta plait domain-containing protein n=1 Tax=Artemisia annua TaxID=35608 RepID=A0A2U1QH01_ARTAN|nr:nucleotide-binding alpha-beta plait domain-containing protein [Artemisia annua]
MTMLQGKESLSVIRSPFNPKSPVIPESISEGISKLGHYSWDVRGGTPEAVQQRLGRHRWDTRGGTTVVGCSGIDLATHVRPFGQIFDLYIARKRDKGGNRFGFVSMLDVNDKDEVLKNLRAIRMGEYKLWFNIARFVLEDGEIHSKGDKPAPPNSGNMKATKGEGLSFFKSGSTGRNERSFKDVLVGKSIAIGENVNAFSTLHGRALVAKMIDVDALKNIYIILNEICPGLGKVQYLGGLDVLISFDDAETAVAALEASKNLMGRFSLVRMWVGQSLGFERLAWLKVQGIPLQLLTNEVLNMVGGTFGKVVHEANLSEKDHDLSSEHVGVLIGDGKRVSEEVELKWRNRKFRVWVLEESGDWILEFTEVQVVKEDDDSVSNDSMNAEHVNDDQVDEDVVENTTDEVLEKAVGHGDDDVSINEATVMLGRTDWGNNDNYDYQSRPVSDGVLNGVTDKMAFVPAVDFNFDQAFNNTDKDLSKDYGLSKINILGLLAPTRYVIYKSNKMN